MGDILDMQELPPEETPGEEKGIALMSRFGWCRSAVSTFICIG